MKLNDAFSDDFICQISRLIFEPVTRGESVFCRWFPGHGKTIRLGQIFAEVTYLTAGLSKLLRKLVIIRIDAENYAVEPLDQFFLYVRKSIINELIKVKLIKSVLPRSFSKAASPVVVTIEEIRQICLDIIIKGFDILFVIEVGNQRFRQEREFYNAWARIVEVNLDHVHTHINCETKVPLDQGMMSAVLIQGLLTVPLPNRDECNHYINYYLNKWQMQLALKQRDTVYAICGHDTWLLKEALRILKNDKSPEKLLYDQNLLLKAKIQYGNYCEKEREVMEIVFKTGHLPRNLTIIAQDLQKANFWAPDLRLPLIIQQVIIQSHASGELVYNTQKNILTLGIIDLSQKLTSYEHGILVKLFKDAGNIVSRDEIAKSIWGGKTEEKYSEWAIDKTMSRLRSRLSLFTNLYHITTRKKQGFVLEI